jgi:hypothetical protein
VRQVAQEDEGVGVRVVQLIPDELARVRADEVRDERRLAGAGVGRDERDGVGQIREQSLGQPRAREQRRRGPRRQELRAQKERGLRRLPLGGRRRRCCGL